MEYNKKLEEIEKIMASIEENNDLDKQMELYEKGKKKCVILEKKINLQRSKIDNIQKDIDLSEEIEDNDNNNDSKDIKQILLEIEEIYKKINSENLPAEKIEEFLKKSAMLKKQSQKFSKNKELNIKYM